MRLWCCNLGSKSFVIVNNVANIIILMLTLLNDSANNLKNNRDIDYRCFNMFNIIYALFDYFLNHTNETTVTLDKLILNY